jgi:hypothetical protein
MKSGDMPLGRDAPIIIRRWIKGYASHGGGTEEEDGLVGSVGGTPPLALLRGVHAPPGGDIAGNRGVGVIGDHG